MTKCTYFESTIISPPILSHPRNYQGIKATVLFLKSNKHEGNVLEQNTTDSAQGTHLELHTWYPYENSERCIPAEAIVPAKMSTGQNFGDITRSEIFKKY